MRYLAWWRGFAGARVTTLPTAEKVTFEVIEQSEARIEELLQCDVLHIYGELRPGLQMHLRDVLETLAARQGKRNALGVVLTTSGGQAEVVEKMVELIRHHYEYLYFVVPNVAMSAGTIFCMAGDRIYMDYASSLGPIDPQVPEKDNKYLVPALGYLDKVAELIQKSRDGTISPAEFMMLEKQDLAMLRFYEQARDLSGTLLKQWLAKYKFKDWIVHRTTNPGSPVTEEDKTIRAGQIADLLSDNKHWHSHGRLIGMKTLTEIVKLDIEDFGANKELSDAIRRYDDVLSGWLNRVNTPAYVYSRHTTN